MRISTLVLALLFWSAASAAGAAEAAPGRHALLVGCTRYDNLAEGLHLEGPGNDTLLLRDLLVQRYGFPKENVRILAEHASKVGRPTRQNIERECRRLADLAHPGDQLVVLFAGHGSLQPQRADTPYPQPDGCDRIFLPCDVGKWDGSKGAIANAIRGDEIGAWLRPIAEKKAALWLIVDACHSGSGVRSADSERKRQIDPVARGGLEIPRAALDRAAQRAVQQPRRDMAPSALPLPSHERIVILYACQASEMTVEKPLPAGAADRRYHGLLTFTLNELLTRADEPLTYLELAQRIQSQYSGQGRQAPTPLVEGKDQNREVLGVKEHPRRSLIRLVKTADGLSLSAGAIHGLLKGSVLAVYPPAGKKETKPLGHVRVNEVNTATARVEPCSFKDHPLQQDLPAQGRCELVAIDYGDMRLKVAVDPADNLGRASAAADLDRLGKILARLAGQPGALLTAVAEPDRADWLVRWHEGKVYLLPGSGLPVGKEALPDLFGPYADNDDLPQTLQDRLGRIARVQNLKRLASAPAGELARSHSDDVVAPAVHVKLEIRLLQDKAGQPIPWPAAGVKFFDGDRVQFVIQNPNPYPVDVTLLYIDSGFAINCLYPLSGEVSRVDANTSRPIPAVRTRTRIDALEHLVLIAVKSPKQQQPIDFSALEQDSLEKAQEVARTRGDSGRGLATPLGQLLQHALYGHGARAIARTDIEEAALVLCSWHVVPAKRP